MPETLPKVHFGSCLCGANKLRIEGDALRQNLCHCSSCQKTTGGSFAHLAAFREEQVSLTQAHPSRPSTLRTYADTTPESGGTLHKTFCGTCGTPLRARRTPAVAGARGVVVVPVGVLDKRPGGGGDDEFAPAVEYFTCRRPRWLPPLQGVETHDKVPKIPQAAE
ncbi:glutathione-dependent formaldehyde-activating, GFA [Xylariomycetidae sp. FL0641]|nr:glutathione-dependent formaldehyde-activating, GFA [Xylariomycetidae sp. FL0641]